MHDTSKVRKFFGIPYDADTQTLIWALVMLGHLATSHRMMYNIHKEAR